MTAMAPLAALPLSNYRIIDLSRVLSGPSCTMMLADLGADVIKVEAPDGDPMRNQDVSESGLSWYFAAFNRNKRSITLDLKTDEGRAILERLIAGADALIDNFRPGVLDRLGFDAARLRAVRPGLVTCSINGFGHDGPYRERPAFDFIAQAMSGFMSVNGGPSDPPLRTGVPISDLVAGIHGALGVTAALLRRERGLGDAAGEHVDVSLVNSMVSLLAYVASHYFAAGEVLPRSGNDHPISSPYGLFQTRDEPIAVAPSDDTFFARLMKGLDMPETARDPDFVTGPLRVRNRARINALVEERLRTNDAAYWIERLNAAGVPCGPVYNVAGVFADPQVRTQNMAIEVDQPDYGPIRMVGFPIKFERAPCEVRKPAPRLGEHSVEILTEIGYAEADVARLKQSGAIGSSVASPALQRKKAVGRPTE
jgi:CoA:oxalate CoA-transferase